MRATTIATKTNRQPEGSPTVQPVPLLHLVLSLDRILEAAATGGEDLARLGNVRKSFAGLVLTIHSDRSPEEAMEMLSLAHVQWPQHLLANGGKSIHHLTRQGGMEPDPDYDEWLGFQGEIRSHERGIVAAGVEYLEICWNTPRPLMALGDIDRDYPLLGLADLPVLEPGSHEGSPRRPQLLARAFWTRQRGLRDVVHLALACLAPDGVSHHSWRVEPRRLQARRSGH